ncbi:tetratricopeptide repeat protein [Rufibacter roseus]|uniref:Tetratricopeptide repeat protein n=1 Tax=Rufibacter roseus TaxID=1567108 RepID=A0ABW2DNU4_9BACT|nr:tetratricopeptide repeat protein [Rufibacter roseus]
MRLAILLIILTTTFCLGQSDKAGLTFKTKYYEAVDKWIAFPKKEGDSTYTFGFIYLDDQAGFTFDYASKFIVGEKGLKALPREFQESLKSRLAPNTANVAVLSSKQIGELGLPNQPEWLSNYKIGSETVPYLKNIGFHYNHVGASHLALAPLTQAYQTDPHYDGLEFELAYAYNALKMFDKAISVLKKAIANNPENSFFYRELGYAYRYSNQMDSAENAYMKGIEISKDDFQKSEMAVNMAQAYYLVRNKEKFNKWAKLTRKHAEKGSRYAQFIDIFEQKWHEK